MYRSRPTPSPGRLSSWLKHGQRIRTAGEPASALQGECTAARCATADILNRSAHIDSLAYERASERARGAALLGIPGARTRLPTGAAARNAAREE